ncbi:DNA ligase 1 [Trichonephila clavipes]|nr:DNA ligase 1 [Trichonephila clavipes]
MSQKTILSFFKQTGTSDVKVLPVEETKVNGDTGKSSTNSNPKKPGRKSNPKKTNTDGSEKKSSVKKGKKTSLDNGISKKSVVKEDKKTDSENYVDDCNNNSPVKQSKKRKQSKQIVESDDDAKGSNESSELQDDNQNDDDEKMEIDDSNKLSNGTKSEVTNDIEETPSKSPLKKKQSAENDESPVKTTKRRKIALIESDDEEEVKPIKSNKKAKIEDSAVEKNIISSESNNAEKQENDECTPSSSESSSAEAIPKRKTAPRRVRGKQNKKDTSTKPQDLDKKKHENEKPTTSLNDSGSALNEKTEKSKCDEKKTEVTEKEVEQESKSDKDSQDEHSDEESKKTESKDTSNLKKAIHPFFAGKKKTTDEKCDKSPEKKDIKCTSTSGTSYDPSKNRYHPIDDACWKKGEKVPYLALAKTLECIEETSARLKMIEILSNFLRSVIVLSPEDLLYCVYLCLNRLAPEYEGIELGIGETLLMKAVAQATGRTLDKIKAEVVAKGDLGLVAESSRGNQRIMFAPPKLTIATVFSKFKEIAKMSGNAAMSKKTDKIQALFVACRDCEAKYIIRSLSGKLRIGLAEQSVLAALARAAVLTPPNQTYPPKINDKSSKMSADSFKEHLQEQTLILKTTYCECPNFDRVIPVLLKESIAGLPDHCQLCPGCPLKPMLAHPTNGIDEVLNRFDKNEFTCEFKYDGERAQIHMTEEGEIKIFSRNQEDNTSKYPDIIARLSKSLKETTKTFILDTEAVAWDRESKQILPFQVLSTRKKKDANEADIVVQVCIMAFDLLYLNGESLVKKNLKERRELLHSSFVEVESEFMFVNYKDGNSAETMQEFLDESVKGNCEGLMVKALTVDASYEIAKRSHNWLKLKKDYLNGVGDTLDLVVIGGYYGKGKRKGFYGGFLLACYDDENEEFQSICKLGTGFSDKELETHANFFKEHVIEEPRSYYRYDNNLKPDVWFDAVQIWEIKCADLSISPVHKAAIGIVDPEKGISLRFPRFLRIREDKSKPEDATVASQVAEMYQKQDQVQNTKNKNIKSEEDYY